MLEPIHERKKDYKNGTCWSKDQSNQNTGRGFSDESSANSLLELAQTQRLREIEIEIEIERDRTKKRGNESGVINVNKSVHTPCTL